MGWELTAYTPVLLTAGVVGLAVAVLVWRNRPRAGAAMLALNLLGNALWALGQGVAVSVTTVPELRWATVLTLVGIALLTPAWLLFALRYTGYDERVGRSVGMAIAAPAVAFVALAAINPEGVVYVARFTDDTARIQWGMAKWAFTGYAYVVGGAGGALLLAKTVRSRNVYRKRTFVLLVGGLAVLLGHAVAVADLSPTPLLTLSPLLFLAFGVLTLSIILSDRVLRLVPADRLLGLLGSRFQNITPIARDLVIETMGSGVVVLDGDNRIVDLNPLARRILGTGDRRIVGRRLGDVVAADAFEDDDLELLDPDRGTGSYDGVWVAGEDGRERCYDVVMTDLNERREDVSGRVAIIHDVTDQQQRKQRLQRRTAQLERQNERLDEFASVVSHDLRNPLNVAQGRLELAEAADAELDGVRDAHERMEAIIDEMLTLAREGQTVDEPTAVDLAAVARDAWATAETAGATLSVEIDGRQVHADEGRLQRAFENLYRNAVDHGTTGSGDLSIRVGALDDGGGFFVEDDGPGIPSERRDDVFEHGFSTDEDGTGFGLSIVESIVEAHGGMITATESESGGVEKHGEPTAREPTSPGARFEVRLPAARSPVEPGRDDG